MFERQIAAGMNFLDGYFKGSSWVWNIDVGELDLKSGCNCILGQVHGDYDHALFELEIDDEEADELGFAVDARQFPTRSESVLWDTLTAEWVDAIKERIDKGVDL